MAEHNSSNKDKIRARFFASRNFKSKRIKLFGMPVEIRQLSLGDTIGMMKGREDIDLEVAADTLIKCAYDPQSGQKIFEETDRQEILNQPMSEWVRLVMDALGELMGTGEEEAVEKN